MPGLVAVGVGRLVIDTWLVADGVGELMIDITIIVMGNATGVQFWFHTMMTFMKDL